MRRRDLDGCPVAGALQMIGDKWTMLIVRDLVNGPRRTLELLSGLFPISSRTLVGRLRDLENDRLIERIDFGGNPPHVEYALTTRGRLLVPLLDSLRQLGELLACCQCEERKQRMGFYCDSCPLSFAESNVSSPELPAQSSIDYRTVDDPVIPDPVPFRRRRHDDSIILL